MMDKIFVIPDMNIFKARSVPYAMNERAKKELDRLKENMI